MSTIYSIAELKDAIQQLENQQTEDWNLLKQQSLITFNSLKPFNIIKNAVMEVVSAPDVKVNIVNAAIGFTTGFVAKNLLMGPSHTIFTKVIGSLVEMSVATNVIKNAGEIKSLGRVILRKIMNRKTEIKNK